ncbi:MAG: histidine phosphatase family protein [Eubacterium sp.]|nr:histidine phosphatase family protein [Eubacterium sp.]
MLYIMRHGETDWNKERKLQGRTDVALNEKGREMAREARERYKDVKFDICFCSPLVRARETAEILLEGTGVPIVFDKRLLEMKFGIYEGVNGGYDDPECPVNVLFRSPEKYKTPVEGGESLDELFARTGEFLREEVEPRIAKNENVLIVAHGALNCSIICQVKDIPVEDFWSCGIENCKLKRLD